MNVLVYVVNYRVDRHLASFIDSVRTAMGSCASARVELHVHDNSERPESERQRFLDAIGASEEWIHVHFSPVNDGYFGGLGRAQALTHDGTDCVLFCNPDVVLAPDLLVNLATIARSTRGIVAPSIVSADDGFDQNPKYAKRLTREKLVRLSRVYSSGLAYATYVGLARIREKILGRKASDPPSRSTAVYAPHGSVLVFTDTTFFRQLPRYPCFLFGEELFVAEEARRHGVPVVYEPSVRVRDQRHASIRLISARARRELMRTSVRYILDRYYDEDVLA
jgi:GT2 family glycosyltransferase